MTNKRQLRHKRNKLRDVTTMHDEFMKPKPMILERVITLQDDIIRLLQDEQDATDTEKLMQTIEIQAHTIQVLEDNVEE